MDQGVCTITEYVFLNHLMDLASGGNRHLVRRRVCAASTQPKRQVQGRLGYDFVVGEGAVVDELFALEDEAHLRWRDAFLVLDAILGHQYGIVSVSMQDDCAPAQSLDKHHVCAIRIDWPRNLRCLLERIGGTLLVRRDLEL
jgi:hypothetical protein